MQRDDLGSLLAFATVARARSFTKAAGRLGTSQSALSHTVRRLEQNLGVKLLNRTTRSVSPTEAGLRLLDTIEPSLETIQRGLEDLSTARGEVAGTVRISSPDHAAERLLWPVLGELRQQHDGLKFELHVENGLVDIVADRFDAGVRLGGNVPKDMVAVPIGGDERSVTVCSPAYLRGRSEPETVADLQSHDCINRTLPTLGGVAPWRFQENGRTVNARVSGSLTFNRPELVLQAAVAGHGIAHLLRSQILPELSSGKLVELLPERSQIMPGYRIYYPRNRQPTIAFRLVLDALRTRHRTAAGG